MALASFLLTTTLRTSAPPPPVPPRTCLPSYPKNGTGVSLFGKGVKTMRDMKVQHFAECCDACRIDSKCGAFFAKLSTKSGGGDCKLYSLASAAKLDRGSCPSSKGTAICVSSNWVVTPSPTPAPPSPTPHPPAPANIALGLTDPTSLGTVSPYLASMSLVYAWAPDAAGYANGTIAQWANAHHINTARFPAGMASYWNWENPSGAMGASTLTTPPAKPLPADQWMSLQKYLDLCNATGMRPLLGVNYNCHGGSKCPYGAPGTAIAKESIARAVRQVQFVLAYGTTQQFEGAFWYIGNEDNAYGHIEVFTEHAVAMKKIDPTMKLFWNDNAMDAEKLDEFLSSTAGALMDGCEFHGKWPYGGTPSWLHPKSVEDYLWEVPLIDYKKSTAWRAKIAPLRAMAKKHGKTNFLLASTFFRFFCSFDHMTEFSSNYLMNMIAFADNEFGLGKSSAFIGYNGTATGGDWNRYLKSLVVVEFALEMVVGGYDIAAFWDNGDGGSPSSLNEPWGGGEHMLLDTSAAWRMNPMHIGLELLATAQSGVRYNLSTSAKRVHGFAVQHEHEQTTTTTATTTISQTTLFTLNKYNVSMPVIISVGNFLGSCGSTSPLLLQSMVDTPDHWGALQSIAGGVTCSSSSSDSESDGKCTCVATLPPLSFSRAELN